MIDVRIEKNGNYYRLVWQTRLGERRSEGLGHKDELTDRQRELRRREKGVQLQADPELAEAGKMRLSQWRVRYTRMAAAELSAGSVEAIGNTFDRLEAYFTDDPLLSSLRPDRAKDFRLWLARQTTGVKEPRPLSLATVRRHIRYCRAIFSRALKERALTGLAANPFADESGAGPKIPKTWYTVTDLDMERILEACPSDGWRAMFALCRWAGTRLSEARRLKWVEIIRTHPPTLLILKPDQDKEDDTKNRNRKTPIEPRLLALLDELFARAAVGSAGPCDGLPEDQKKISVYAATIAKRAGLAYAKPLHTLRKNRITEWRRKVPLDVVTEWVGNSPDVAEDHYIRAEQSDFEQITGPAAKAPNSLQNPISPTPQL